MINEMITAAATSVPARSEARKSFLHSVFTTALEGGIGYWSNTDEYHWSQGGSNSMTGAMVPPDDLDGFFAILESSEDDWGVSEAYISEQGQFQPITETQSLRVDLDVIERGTSIFVDRVIAATKSEDPRASCSNPYFRQFVEAWMSDGASGDFDADGADIIVQLGLFGEIVYA